MLFYDDPVGLAAGSNVIPFPTHVRLITLCNMEVRPVTIAKPDPWLISHGGRHYRLLPLLDRLPEDHHLILMNDAPRPGQETWDAVVRRWPALADCIAASVVSVAVAEQ